MAQTVITFSKNYLILESIKCGRHCDKLTRFVSLLEARDLDLLVGAYVDPENYVSRVVYFSQSPDSKWFEEFLKPQVGTRLRSKDLRYATRHGWELGPAAEKDARELDPNSQDAKIIEYYWTFYPQSGEDKAKGTFLCSVAAGGCGKRLFVKPIEDASSLCDSCSSKNPRL